MIIETKYRKIAAALPIPESVSMLDRLDFLEPRGMTGQPKVVWERAQGFQVYDPYGNCWIDFSSGVLVANAGHGRPEIRDAVQSTLDQGLHHNYMFPSRPRLELLETLHPLLPAQLEKVFLLTTGSETVECALKISRAYGMQIAGKDKITVVSFHNAFHGRTLGAQQAGGIPGLKSWIGNLDPDFVQLSFPDDTLSPEITFRQFEQSLQSAGKQPQQIACVLLETYQGGTAAFAPATYMQALRDWCTNHKVLLICDEVQAAFGRTGKMFGFEHYGIVPDLVCFGKGITSGLPLSALAGPSYVLDQFGPGEMSSTHSGNPLACRAATANLKIIQSERLHERAAQLGQQMHAQLQKLQHQFPAWLEPIRGRGLVAGIHFKNQLTGPSGGKLAQMVVDYCVDNGVLLFNPVGPGGATIKVNPPLVIKEDALNEGLEVLSAAIRAVCSAHQ